MNTLLKRRIKPLYYFLITGLAIITFSSCEDPELDSLMADYCDCISESRYDDSKHIECIEKMDSIKSKYKGQPRKIVKVIEKTDECY